MKIREVVDALERFAPLPLQEGWDNAGLQVGLTEAEVSGALLCLDVTESVVDEALQKGCNLIVSHHPLIFRALKHVTGATEIERTVIKAIRNNIAIVSMHTNMDNARGGVNFKIAEKMGLCDVRFIGEDGAAADKGSGVVGELTVSMAAKDFIGMLKTVFKVECVQCNRLHWTHSTLNTVFNIPIKSFAAMETVSSPTTPLPLSAAAPSSPIKRTSHNPIFSAILKFTPPRALSMLVCIDTMAMLLRIAFITVLSISVAPVTCFRARNISGWCDTMRLHPFCRASSTTLSVTSRHNNAPDTSASVNPTCRPALSQPSCKGRGAKRSRASTTSLIFTLFSLYFICFRCKITYFSTYIMYS